MRVSVDSEDFKKLGQRAKVWLDGVELSDVRMADDVEGHVIVYSRDAAGRIDWDRNTEELITQDLYGAVRIELYNA